MKFAALFANYNHFGKQLSYNVDKINAGTHISEIIMAIQPLTLSTVLADYIQLRRSGRSMDDAVSEMTDAAFRLTREERKQLGQIVTEWEGRYGANPRSAPPMARPDAPVQKQPTPAPFGTSYLNPAKIPGAMMRPGEQPVPCPRCGKPNARGLMNCQFCKQALPPTPVVTRKLDSPEPTVNKIAPIDTSYFGPNSTLLMTVQGQKKPFEAYPRSQLIIGRVSPMNPKPVNIDLTNFDGENLGVSRNHAQLKCQDNLLLLSDLRSGNGTFVNETRLYPSEARVLRTGDEIRLGKMVIKIHFKHS